LKVYWRLTITALCTNDLTLSACYADGCFHSHCVIASFSVKFKSYCHRTSKRFSVYVCAVAIAWTSSCV